MADPVNPSGEPPVNPQGSDEPGGEPNSKPNGSDDPANSPADTDRKLQSERDKLRAENQKLEERLADLEAESGERARDRAAKTFLTENKDKFKDVDVSDLAFATSPEDFETLATKAQVKADRIRNKALEDVRTATDDDLSDEEAEKELKKLEKDHDEAPKKGNFQDFLRIKQRRKR